jgi:hypothetical protein
MVALFNLERFGGDYFSPELYRSVPTAVQDLSHHYSEM